MAAVVAAALQGLLIYVLVMGLAVGVPKALSDDLKLFGVAPPPPPPVEKPHPQQAAKHRPDGAASPPNLRAKATEVVAPPPPIVLPPPPQPVVAAPVAGVGTQSSAGAANVAGPGTGAGGAGNGLGSGDGGKGDGAGDGTPARLKSGRIKDSDYPRSVWEAGVGRSLHTVIEINAEGRVTDCRVARSSGNAEYDAITCRIVVQRFRFVPARDRNGRPTADEFEGEHEWTSPPPAPDQDER